MLFAKRLPLAQSNPLIKQASDREILFNREIKTVKCGDENGIKHANYSGGSHSEKAEQN